MRRNFNLITMHLKILVKCVENIFRFDVHSSNNNFFFFLGYEKKKKKRTEYIFFQKNYLQYITLFDREDRIHMYLS